MTWKERLVWLVVVVGVGGVLGGAVALGEYMADPAPFTLHATMRRAVLPTVGAVTVTLDTPAGSLTLSGEMDEQPILRWLILHGGQPLTLTVQPTDTQRAGP